MYFIFSAGAKISISRCDGQMKTATVFGVNYTTIDSHCNCTILPKYNKNITFASNSITENCSTEITILDEQKTELFTIPCEGKRKKIPYNITQDKALYMTSRSVKTTTEPERFLQDITIFGGIQLFY